MNLTNSEDSSIQKSLCFPTDEAANPLFLEKLDNNKEECKKFIILGSLGEGSFGKVKEAMHVVTEETIAIKILEKERIKKSEDLIRIKREMNILTKCQHSNIIQLYEIIETKRYYFFVMEYAKMGELSKYIKKMIRLTESESANFFIQILNGQEYIHSSGFVHRDIKPTNLLLDEDLNIKIIDFGLGNFFDKQQQLKTPCGSPCYAAPEVISGEVYEPTKVDIWSAGITLFAMATGFLPFDEDNKAMLYHKILSCDYVQPSFLSQNLKDLLRKILCRNPNKRLNITEIKKHKWFENQYDTQNKKFIVVENDNNAKHKINRPVLKYAANKCNIHPGALMKMLKDYDHNKFSTVYFLLEKKFQRGELHGEILKMTQDENNKNKQSCGSNLDFSGFGQQPLTAKGKSGTKSGFGILSGGKVGSFDNEKRYSAAENLKKLNFKKDKAEFNKKPLSPRQKPSNLNQSYFSTQEDHDKVPNDNPNNNNDNNKDSYDKSQNDRQIEREKITVREQWLSLDRQMQFKEKIIEKEKFESKVKTEKCGPYYPTTPINPSNRTFQSSKLDDEKNFSGIRTNHSNSPVRQESPTYKSKTAGFHDFMFGNRKRSVPTDLQIKTFANGFPKVNQNKTSKQIPSSKDNFCDNGIGNTPIGKPTCNKKLDLNNVTMKSNTTTKNSSKLNKKPSLKNRNQSPVVLQHKERRDTYLNKQTIQDNSCTKGSHNAKGSQNKGQGSNRIVKRTTCSNTPDIDKHYNQNKQIHNSANKSISKAQKQIIEKKQSIIGTVGVFNKRNSISKNLDCSKDSSQDFDMNGCKHSRQDSVEINPIFCSIGSQKGANAIKGHNNVSANKSGIGNGCGIYRTFDDCTNNMGILTAKGRNSYLLNNSFHTPYLKENKMRDFSAKYKAKDGCYVEKSKIFGNFVETTSVDKILGKKSSVGGGNGGSRANSINLNMNQRVKIQNFQMKIK